MTDCSQHRLQVQSADAPKRTASRQPGISVAPLDPGHTRYFGATAATGERASDLVTIMIPTYGQARFLADAIDSALKQDHPNLEVVVIDDASPDQTPTVAERYLSHPKFRYIRNPTNLGRVRNYRKALYEYAQGVFVLNLDGDDWLTDTSYVSDAMRLVRAHQDLALVFANACVFDASTGQHIRYAQNVGLPTICHGTELLRQRAFGTIEIPHLTALYRRDLAMRLGFYGRNINAADSLSFHLLLPGNQIGYINRDVACWRRHENNASSLVTVKEMLADFAAADIPAKSLIARGLMQPSDARAWRRRMSITIGYRRVARLILKPRYSDAIYFLLRMLMTRPLAGIEVIRTVFAEGAVRMLHQINSSFDTTDGEFDMADRKKGK